MADVEGVETVLLAKIELASGDDGVRPARVLHVGYPERPALAIGLGRRVHQHHETVLVTEVEPAVGIGDGRGAAAVVADRAPGDFSRLEPRRDGESRVVSRAGVQIALVENDSSVMVLERSRWQEIDLGGLDTVRGRSELEKSRTGLVSRRAEDEISAHDRSRNVRDVVRDAVVAPEELPVRGANADEAAADELHVLPYARAFR